MIHSFRRAWDDMLLPLLQRPKRLQVAALCYRETENGKRVLLIGEGLTVPVEAQVYLTRVRDLSEDYPEADARKRAWFAPQDAANLVDEPDLKAILNAL